MRYDGLTRRRATLSPSFEIVGAYERPLSLRMMIALRPECPRLLSPSKAMPPVIDPSPMIATTRRPSPSSLSCAVASRARSSGSSTRGCSRSSRARTRPGSGSPTGRRPGAGLTKSSRRPGDDLVHVGLVAGVPQHDVAGRVEDAVHGEGELDRAEVGAEVPAGPGTGDGIDDELADLAGELVEFWVGEPPEVFGAAHRIEEHGATDGTAFAAAFTMQVEDRQVSPAPSSDVRRDGRRTKPACAPRRRRRRRGCRPGAGRSKTSRQLRNRRRLRDSLPKLRAAGAGQTVLLVEDEEAILQVARETLRSAGYAVQTANGPEQALRVCETEWPDIALIDLMMPGGGGAPVVRELRARDVGLPVIVMSGLSEDEAKAAAPEASGFLQKPLTLVKLFDTVQAALALPH